MVIKFKGFCLEIVNSPVSLAIPIHFNGSSVNCYNAPPPKVFVVMSNGSPVTLEGGAPVNFYNVTINPHGNGTHTECLSHIHPSGLRMKDIPLPPLLPAYLTSATPNENIISTLNFPAENMVGAALIVRTKPNGPFKKHRNYTGSNPPWFEPALIEKIQQAGIMHILTDLPSLDPEKDEGRLLAHKKFWNISGEMRTDSTITELIYVPENMKDGWYVLHLSWIPLDLDAAPSNPVIYKATML